MVKQGDIVFVNFNPSVGHEQNNSRPGIVLTNDLVAEKSNISIVAPISSTKRDFPMYYKLESTKKVFGKVLLDQTKALDLKARNIESSDVKDSVSSEELDIIIKRYFLLFSID
ncbi:type II toxin-antitoxin system PemK/MazF family toxin [Companilactobacillus mishanensis]|uniref:type II toxin-antitoxin system PemK/MazF family toxin n=1 Tax=Companilactobacillus mishanensis TaxID=2486008 RepID=UPI00129597C0|nr:type II toxin-antitoxin system PemK/MazF family toxin [Companilactobacillus mishanensis]MQS89581.1 type II toxin-antitoxin system PemK/MazF family toxin [Companilactobacillus mishanensis]